MVSWIKVWWHCLVHFEIFEKFLFAKYFKMAEENREYRKVFDGLSGLVMKHADIYSEKRS